MPQRHASISVVLCSSNEAANLANVLSRLSNGIYEVVLVDAHSTDGTVEVARRVRTDIRILYQTGRGKDDALKFGIREARGDVVITMDCDGETAPEDLQRFVEPLFHEYDFVKGSRFSSGWCNKPFIRILGNWIILSTFNVLFRTSFSDVCSGYNAFWKERTVAVGLWSGKGWYYEPRIVARALKRGLRVVEVGQTYSGRMGGESKLPNWRQGLSALRYVVLERFGLSEP